MTTGLPAVINPHDEAAARPTDSAPSLNTTRAVTEDCEEVIVIGEGAPEEMEASGAWIQYAGP